MVRKRRKKRSTGQNKIYKDFIFSLDYLRKVKAYFLFSCLLFLLSIILGFAFPGIFEEQVKKVIESLVEQTAGLSGLELICFIIFNNIKSAFFALVLGVFFGIVPFVVALVNGYVLGFVMNATVSAEGASILWRLFPHGILELPAVILSISLGIRLGMFLFTYKGRRLKEDFFRQFFSSLKVFVFIIIPLLVIAGFIEGLLILFID